MDLKRGRKENSYLNWAIGNNFLYSNSSTHSSSSYNKNKFLQIKRSQLTIFVIVAIVLVAGIVLFFALRGGVEEEGLSKDIRPVEKRYLGCLENRVEAGISILEEQGGYIYLPEFEPGSSFMPQGSQLGFMGSPVPYWYYVSGGNRVKDQRPSREEMERQLERYIEDMECDFSEFRRKGYSIDVGDKNSRVKVKENEVEVDLGSRLEVKYGNQSAVIEEHEKTVGSSLGSLYETAKKIYLKEKQQAFLENYTLDTLYSYVPVNGVELSCSPKVWMKSKIKDELVRALEGNIQMLRTGGYEGDMEYFDLDLGVDEQVQFLYSRDWPTKIEVKGEGEIMKAEPVGREAGMGVLGFCYAPYHFVYDLSHPVMVQIYDEEELFQFPLTVIIDKNKPREALPGEILQEEQPEVCKYKNNKMTVYTYGYGTDLKPVEADVEFKCFNQRCEIGKSELKEGEAVLTTNFPKCVNGFIIGKADGYEKVEKQVSTNQEGEVNLVMDKLYKLDTSLLVDGKETSDRAVIYFRNGQTTTLIWPSQEEVELSEGQYNITVQVYRNSSIYLEGKQTKKCVEVARPGVLGLFGSTTERCFDIDIPGQEVSNVIVGGGQASKYITQSQLEKGKLEIRVKSIGVPSSTEELSRSYTKLERQNVYLDFRE